MRTAARIGRRSRFLTDPDELTDELLAESSDQGAQAVAEAERDSLLVYSIAPQSRMRRTRAIDLYTRGKLSEVEFDAMEPPTWNGYTQDSLMTWSLSRRPAGCPRTRR